LRARAALRAFDEPQLHRAIRDIEDGLARAGENPLLLATKGDAAWQLYNIGLAPAERQMVEVRAIAERIASLDPGSAHVERLLGLVAAHTGRMLEAARRLEKAAELDPADTFSALLAVCALALVGRIDEAERLQARVQAIDPLDPVVAAMRMWVTMMSGRFEEAAQSGTSDYERWSGIPAFVTLYVQALASAGRVSEAIRVARELERTRPSDQWTWFSQSFRWALQGDGASLLASLTVERRQWVVRDAQYSHMLAQAFALSGHPDQAFEWLEVMLSLEAAPYPYLSTLDPLLSRLRPDPRWAPFIARVKARWEQNRAEAAPRLPSDSQTS
jgi:tetratricopeptide (TPR) repeat protein